MTGSAFGNLQRADLTGGSSSTGPGGAVGSGSSGTGSTGPTERDSGAHGFTPDVGGTNDPSPDATPPSTPPGGSTPTVPAASTENSGSSEGPGVARVTNSYSDSTGTGVSWVDTNGNWWTNTTRPDGTSTTSYDGNEKTGPVDPGTPAPTTPPPPPATPPPEEHKEEEADEAAEEEAAEEEAAEVEAAEEEGWVDFDAADASGGAAFDAHLTGFDRLSAAGGSIVDIAYTNTGNPNDGVGGPLDLSGATLHIPSRDTIAHVDSDAADASGATAFDTHLTGLDYLGGAGGSIIDVRFTNTGNPNGPVVRIDPAGFDPSTVGPDGTNALQASETGGFAAPQFMLADANLDVSFETNQFESVDNFDTGALQLDASHQEFDADVEASGEFGGNSAGPLPFP